MPKNPIDFLTKRLESLLIGKTRNGYTTKDVRLVMLRPNARIDLDPSRDQGSVPLSICFFIERKSRQVISMSTNREHKLAGSLKCVARYLQMHLDWDSL